ncbi:M16 family metallopeptidase [Modestobacter italicus]|uniref:M16 family metallopeptidase n=1 Tax=Modestobacter italicus (strain DSM 44449 / CECT 9708 / BC 501) TaxID=2732864 RepID=UPI001C96ABFC|nr:pitrilysin family protein [Modestobacter italicus]
MTARPTPSVETLPNGLTLVVAPAVTAGVATVAVHVGVGSRAEPAAWSGLAHLFEHLMFAGSAHVEPGGHFAAVEAVGGRVGGHTRLDHTELFDVVPAEAVPDVVGLEADRLAGPRLAPDTLATQVDVIRAEVAQQVTGAPYGGFPWLYLPPVMYPSPRNTHDGYGDVSALAEVTVEDCARFFDTWYDPRRVVVTLEGDVTASADAARELLAAVPRRGTGPLPPTGLDEPLLTADRHEVRAARNVPEPVWAVGFRLPDPVRSPALHAACTALTLLLPVHAPELRLTARSGWYGVPADARSPDALVLSTHPRPGVTGGQLTAGMRDLLAQWGRRAPAPPVLRTAAARLRLVQHQRAERLGHRARRLGACQLLYGDARLDESLDPAAALDRDLLADAAEHLLDQHVASVLVEPAGTGEAP